MGKISISIILAAALTTAILLSGCTATGPRGLVTEEKKFTDFTYVEVEGTFEVEITQSDTFSTTVSGDASSFDYIAVAKEGGKLRIYLNPRHTFTDFTLQAKALKAKITMPALHGVQLSGASEGTITGFNSSEDFNLDVSGASSLEINDMEIGNVEFKVSGASKVTGDVNAGDVKIQVSGASQVKLKGTANDLVLTASGASKVNLADVPLGDVDIKLSGASEATVNAKGRLDSSLSAASRLYFLGNPDMGDIDISGASTIKHK